MYTGYGIDTNSDHFKLKADAAEKHEEYRSDNDLDSKDPDSFEAYAENYKDEDSVFSSFEALLVAVLNSL